MLGKYKVGNSPGERIMRGIELDDKYVDSNAKLHLVEDLDYRIAYMDYLLVDRLFNKPYSACMTGCGTFGYAKLLKHATRLVGVELSQKMINTLTIAAAQKILRKIRSSAHESRKLNSLYWQMDNRASLSNSFPPCFSQSVAVHHTARSGNTHRVAIFFRDFSKVPSSPTKNARPARSLSSG